MFNSLLTISLSLSLSLRERVGVRGENCGMACFVDPLIPASSAGQALSFFLGGEGIKLFSAPC